MRSRLTVALLVLNAVMAATLVFGLLRRAGPEPDRPLTTVAPADVTALRLFAQREVDLRLSMNGWEIVLDGEVYPARSDRIEALLQVLGDGRLVREVTREPDLYPDFGLDEGQARRVELDAASRSFEFLFGSTGESPDTVYYRTATEEAVWLADAAVDFYLRQPMSFWAYLRLFPENAHPSNAVRAEVDLSAGSAPIARYARLELVRDADERWRASFDGRELPVGADAASGYVRELVDLVASGFYDGAVDGLPTVGVFSFLLSDGRRYSVDVRTDGETLVAVPQGRGLPGAPYGGLDYTLPPERLSRLTPERSALEE